MLGVRQSLASTKMVWSLLLWLLKRFTTAALPNVVFGVTVRLTLRRCFPPSANSAAYQLSDYSVIN